MDSQQQSDKFLATSVTKKLDHYTLIQFLSCLSEQILHFSQASCKLTFPVRYSSTARRFKSAGYILLRSDGISTCGPSVLYWLNHRLMLVSPTPVRWPALLTHICPDRHASDIFIFSSAMYLLHLDMTTPPIENFLSSIRGAYHYIYNIVLSQVYRRRE